MQVTKPSYYDQFHCLGGSCPDTCCADWEICIDDAHLQYYTELPGPLGDTIRAAVVDDAEPRFGLDGSHCRLLRPDGLCTIQAALGEQALCRVCGFYPRFVTELGLIREQGLSISCPEAARLILTQAEPVHFPTQVTPEPLREYYELDPNLILGLRSAARYAFAIAQNRSESIALRCCRLLQLADPVQLVIDDGDYAALPDALAQADAAARAWQPKCAAVPGCVRDALYRQFLCLEPLRPQWTALLEQAWHHATPQRWTEGFPAAPTLWEQLLCYNIYRYFLRASFDGLLEEKVKFAVVSVILLQELAQLLPEPTEQALIDLAQRYGRELENSEDNLSSLDEAFCGDPAFDCDSLCAWLSQYI